MVEQGHSLSGALMRSDYIVPKSLIVLAKIGEETGSLGKTLVQSADWMDEDIDILQSVKNALTYPMLVVIVSMLLTLFLFTSIVPRLLEVVVKLGGDLPFPTRVIQTLCWLIMEPGFWMAAGALVCAVVSLLLQRRIREKFYTGLISWAKLLPLLGPMLTAFFHVRFCAGLAVLSEQGVEILRATSLAQEVTEDPMMQADIRPFRERVQTGENLTNAMRSRPDLYDGLLVSFVALGEESASLPNSLEKAASIYKMLLNEKLDAFKQSLEPLLTIGVGVVVGFVLVATLLPLYSVLSKF